jgi:hypothetical protein
MCMSRRAFYEKGNFDVTEGTFTDDCLFKSPEKVEGPSIVIVYTTCVSVGIVKLCYRTLLQSQRREQL